MIRGARGVSRLFRPRPSSSHSLLSFQAPNYCSFEDQIHNQLIKDLRGESISLTEGATQIRSLLLQSIPVPQSVYIQFIQSCKTEEHFTHVQELYEELKTAGITLSSNVYNILMQLTIEIQEKTRNAANTDPKQQSGWLKTLIKDIEELPQENNAVMTTKLITLLLQEGLETKAVQIVRDSMENPPNLELPERPIELLIREVKDFELIRPIISLYKQREFEPTFHISNEIIRRYFEANEFDNVVQWYNHGTFTFGGTTSQYIFRSHMELQKYSEGREYIDTVELSTQNFHLPALQILEESYNSLGHIMQTSEHPNRTSQKKVQTSIQNIVRTSRYNSDIGRCLDISRHLFAKQFEIPREEMIKLYVKAAASQMPEEACGLFRLIHDMAPDGVKNRPDFNLLIELAKRVEDKTLWQELVNLHTFELDRDASWYRVLIESCIYHELYDEAMSLLQEYAVHKKAVESELKFFQEELFRHNNNPTISTTLFADTNLPIPSQESLETAASLCTIKEDWDRILTRLEAMKPEEFLSYSYHSIIKSLSENFSDTPEIVDQLHHLIQKNKEETLRDAPPLTKLKLLPREDVLGRLRAILHVRPVPIADIRVLITTCIERFDDCGMEVVQYVLEKQSNWKHAAFLLDQLFLHEHEEPGFFLFDQMIRNRIRLSEKNWNVVLLHICYAPDGPDIDRLGNAVQFLTEDSDRIKIDPYLYYPLIQHTSEDEKSNNAITLFEIMQKKEVSPTRDILMIMIRVYLKQREINKSRDIAILLKEKLIF